MCPTTQKSLNKEILNSFQKIGPLYPVLMDSKGNIIDGEHRNSINESWPKFVLENVKSEKERLILRVVSNNQRRNVSNCEKSRQLSHLAKIFVEEGITQGKLGYQIAEATGMSYQWVMKYLPEQFKDDKQADRAKSALCHRATNSNLRDPPEGVISIIAYRNTDFVNIVVQKSLYEKLAEKAKEWEVTPDTIIYNALISMQNGLILKLLKSN